MRGRLGPCLCSLGWLGTEPRYRAGIALRVLGPGWNARVPRAGSGSKRVCGLGKGHSPGAPASLVAVGVDREAVRIPGFTAGIAHCDLPQEAAK